MSDDLTERQFAVLRALYKGAEIRSDMLLDPIAQIGWCAARDDLSVSLFVPSIRKKFERLGYIARTGPVLRKGFGGSFRITDRGARKYRSIVENEPPIV